MGCLERTHGGKGKRSRQFTISSRKLADANNGLLQNKYGFQGKFASENDFTSWNEYQVRMYDPQIGRWTSIDPVVQFASPYVGMGNNPASSVDPDGAATDPYYYLSNRGGLHRSYAWSDILSLRRRRILFDRSTETYYNISLNLHYGITLSHRVQASRVPLAQALLEVRDSKENSHAD